MEFQFDIKRKKENHEEGESMTAEHLMLLTDSKYKLQLESVEGWGIAPNPHKKKILALEAKIAKMDKVAKPKPSGISSEFYKEKCKGSGRGPTSDKPAFMDHAPPKGDIKDPFKPRQWKGKDWCYCHKSAGGKCAGTWLVHNPADCKGKAHDFKGSKEYIKKKSKYDSCTLKS